MRKAMLLVATAVLAVPVYADTAISTLLVQEIHNHTQPMIVKICAEKFPAASVDQCTCAGATANKSLNDQVLLQCTTKECYSDEVQRATLIGLSQCIPPNVIRQQVPTGNVAAPAPLTAPAAPSQ